MADRGDIDRVREATDLVDLFAEVTKVRRSGRSFMAVCPFHQEKTPSMSLDRARGLYHCFGCGEGGDVFTFLQKTQGLEFIEALESLARRAGITITRDPEAARKRGRRDAAVAALRRAIDVYHDRLKRSSEAGPARAYLRGRGYDIDLIEEWKLGFAGVDWDTAVKALRTAGVDDRAMLEAGLARRGRHGLYDVFRGRLMFPIHDVRGDAVGFGGRRLEEIDAQATNNPDAKYVNSADSIVYQKARLLFGLDRARGPIADEGRAVVVEGYTDVIAMHRAGVKTAVATCGTALGDGHFDLLRRFTEQVVLAFDSDEAGTKAALRSDDLESPFRLDLDLRVAVMPDGLDPADLVQEGRSPELIEAVESARPLLEHRIEHDVERFDVSGPEGRARALHAAVAQLKRVNDDIARTEYARFVARLIGVDLDTVRRALGTRLAGARGNGAAPGRPLDRAEAELLRVVLHNPPDRGDVRPEDFTDERLRRAYLAVADELADLDAGTSVDLTSLEDESTAGLLRSLAMDDRPLPDWTDLERRLKGKRLDVEIDALESRLASLDSATDDHSAALRELTELQRQKRALTQEPS